MLKPGLIAFGDLRPGDRFEDLDGEPNEVLMKVNCKEILYGNGWNICVSLQTGRLKLFEPDVVVKRRDNV